MMQDYNLIVERISKSSGRNAEEVNRLVEAKRAKLSGLISKEGAAQIVASELGISFDKEKSKVNELLPGMKRANITGKILRIFPVRDFKKENREGKVVNLILADETGNIKTVLWDTNHISLIENRELVEGDVVDIANASFRNTELHLGGFSDIKKSNKMLGEVKTEMDFFERKISDFNVRGNFKTRAVIVQVFEPRFFDVCPECSTKVLSDAEGSLCEKHGRVIPRKRALLSIVLDDSSGSIRGVLFSEQIEKLGLKEEELVPEIFFEKRKELLGKEAYFLGNTRQNKLFGNMEFFVSDIQDIDIEKLIEMLEK